MKTTVEGKPVAREFLGSGLSKEEREAELEAIGPVLSDERAAKLIAATSRLPAAERKAAENLVKQNVDRRLDRNLNLYISKMEELAEGVYYEEEVKLKSGVTIRRVYKSKPDRLALEYLIDRRLGTPTKVSDSKVKSESSVKILSVNLNGSTPKSLPNAADGSDADLHIDAESRDVA